MEHYGVCEKCRQPVTSQSGPPAWPVHGWEVQREQGGANHIRDRQRIPGRVRHAHCLPTVRERSIAEGQEEMALDDSATTAQRVGYDGRSGAPGFS